MLLQSFHIAFRNHCKLFLKSFYKAFIMLFYRVFVIKLFQILSTVLILSLENTTETLLTSEKCRLTKLCKVDAWSQALLFTGETSFLFGFSLTFRTFACKSKNRLNTSLLTCWKENFLLFS